ncbi:MAG: glycosyltransferase family 4 protein [Candidatus Iainarchaeum archaeon]|uniref:Glycosyltransferase family 4 protein n=1 Tax=Candidatus Iainarchaeum sp. TaxID=3101447 RepID=A0A7T9I275_9ARCH|nr:MAG: glycosyltransferase family 4 protein [Candidatus Diapherotrites archaeon]
MRAILWLGREPTYIRNDVVIKGLKECGIELVICADTSPNIIVRFVKSFLAYIRAVQQPHDFVWVGFFGHPLVWLAKRFTRKKVLLDMWLSAYETMVHARKSIKDKTLGATFFKWLDAHAVRSCDAAIFPSQGEMNYFIHKLHHPKEKMRLVLIGVNTDQFIPTPKKPSKKVVVEFHGTFLTVSSVETIVRAAKELEKNNQIEFWLIGTGQTFDADVSLAKELGLKNVQFLGRKPYREIPGLLNQSDISLGIFGSGEKANRILPTKMYEAMALAKPSITARSDGVLELLKEEKSVLLVAPYDAKDLAAKIEFLAKNPAKRKKIGEAAHDVFLEKATPKKIGEQIIKIVKE